MVKLLNSGHPKVAENHLEKGKILTEKRQKPNKLADREQGDWFMVNKYLSNYLVSKSDDKKILSEPDNPLSKNKKK